jgi:histone H3/H4
MEDGYLCSVHGKRVTLMEKDLHLVNKRRVAW